MSILRIAIVSILLGPVYMMFVFGGFIYAPAAHSGIFMNGSLPLMTILISMIWLKEKTTNFQILGIIFIILGAVSAVLETSHLELNKTWFGDILFLVAGIVFSGYVVVSRVWKIKLTELFLCSSLVNCILYLPIWFIFLPKTLNQVPVSDLLIQAIYQGIVPTLIGLVLVSISARHIGSASTSAFLAGVPAVATILSMIFLDEYLGFYGWLGICLITPGILIVALMQNQEI